MRRLLRPFGHLLFIVGIGLLGYAALVFGEGYELGFFLRRSVCRIWQYPNIVIPGLQVLAALWLGLFIGAMSDDVAWDDLVVGVLGVLGVFGYGGLLVLFRPAAHAAIEVG